MCKYSPQLELLGTCYGVAHTSTTIAVLKMTVNHGVDDNVALSSRQLAANVPQLKGITTRNISIAHMMQSGLYIWCQEQFFIDTNTYKC